MFWGYGFRGRPARASVEVLAELIDASSVGGGTFELGSQAFAMTRVVTGQLDAVIEVGSRLVDDVPGMRAEFERVGDGQILNNSPYDLAAPWLCLSEAGGVVTDGWGEPLDRHRLLGSGHEFQMSSISASNAQLHAELVRAMDAGVARLQALVHVAPPRGASRPEARGPISSRRAPSALRHSALVPTLDAPARSLSPKQIADYASIVGRPLVEEILERAERLRGKRILHVSATAFGGGVSEILYTLVPLMVDVGLSPSGT